MSFSDNYFALMEEDKKKKKKKDTEKKTGHSFTDNFNSLVEDDDIAPVKTTAPLYTNMTSSFFVKNSVDIAPTTKATGKTKAEETDERKWFETGAFEDGYQFGDVFKTLLGTDKDILQNMGQGVRKFGENVIDAGATAVGFVGEKIGADGFAKKTKDFVAKDLSKELSGVVGTSSQVADAVARVLGANPMAQAIRLIPAVNTIVNGEKDNSVLGDKSDALVQSATQFAMQGSLVGVGVPWWVTAGVTSFGNEAETAFTEGATYNEAALSGVISAGGEILTEKLFGGSGLGEKGLINLEPLTKGISNKVVKALADYGVDLFAEGSEEVVSQVIGNLGSALYKEENLMDILTSEEAIDGYIESFVGGAVISGGANVGKVSSSIKSGRDYRTGLSTNEQKVIDKEIENRIAEQEKDGKKLTNKEKAKIEEEVIRDMDRGYISTDTIEEVLGGETYKTHKDTIESEKAMQEEYDLLYKMKNGEKSDEQVDRQAELKQKLEDIKQNFNRNQLGDEVMSMVKGDRLVESYNERYRRGQAFEADITKYDAKQQATIQKAIDSGILNNTNRTHEFVDMIAKITADKGVSFDFTDNAKLKESGFAVDGKAVNGYVTKDGVTLNIDSAKALNRVVGHEITHVLEGTEMYTALQSVVTEYAKTKGEYQTRYDSLTKLYESIEGADINAELTADLVGDYLFTDADFVKHLSVTDRNVFQKIYDEIKYLCKIATAGSKEARELERVKRTFEKIYREGGKAQTDTKYSLENGNKRKYNKRIRYNEAETLFLSWENGSAPVGEVKRFVRFGKVRYYEKTENGCVELSRQQFNERNGENAENTYRRAEREVSEAYDYDESTQRGLLGDYNRHRDTSGTPSVFGQAFREELPDVTAGSESGVAGYDSRNDINQSEYNKEASDESGASFTFSNDYAAVRNFMKEGDAAGEADDAPVNYSLSDSDDKPTADADIRYSLSDAQPEYTTKSEVQFSLSNDTAYMDKAIAANNSYMTVDSNIMAEAKVLRERIAGRMNDIKDRGLVALPDDVEGNTYIANSSYDGTEENTTICPRSLASEAFVDAVSEYLGRPLTVEEQIYISQDLQGRTLTPKCLYCYVATDRKAYRAFLGEWVKQRDAVIEKLKANPNADVSRSGELYNEFRNGRKDTDQMYNRFKMWVNAYKNGTPMIDGSHLANINKLMGDINSEFGAELKPQIVDAMKYAQSASWAKKRVNYVAYNGHILKWKQNRINKLNSHYGLRMYSFSDFHPAFVLENMQMITDASVRGLKMLGYTKDTDFVEIFAPTGMNINVSTFGFESGGQVFENNIIGANWDTAKALREQYPNVGVTFVATNDTLVEWALEQDWIDVVIPYHLVRTGAEVAKALNYTNYTSESSDTKKANWKKGDAKYIAPTEHNNDLETYLAALEKNNLNPRFERFLNNPKTRSNYMKLVNECRQPASESKPVQPIFNEDAAMKALAKLEANGYYQPIGGSVDRMYEIAAEVAESMTQQIAPMNSLSDAGYKPLAPLTSFDVYGKDLMKVEETAPVQETAPVSETTGKTNIPVSETKISDMFPDDAYAPIADDPERFDSLTDEDAPPVRNVEHGEHGNQMTMPKSTVNMIAQNVKSALWVEDNQMGDLHRLIDDYAKAEFPSREQLFQDLKDKFGTATEKIADEATQDVKRVLRKYRLNVSDSIKSEIADYGNLRRQNFGKVLFSRQGTPVDVAYEELSSMYPGYFPKDITNPTDQLLQIIDVANMSHTSERHYEIDDQAVWDAVDDIIETIHDYQSIQRERDAGRTQTDYLDDLVKHGDEYAPVTGDVAPVAETKTEEPKKTVQTTRRKLAAEIRNLETEMGNNERLREQSNADFDAEIAKLQAEYDALKNKNTILANDILRKIERTRRMKNNVDGDYARRIKNLFDRIVTKSSDKYQTAAQRKVKQQEYTEQMENLVGDTATWRDKKLGISYKVNTLRRNLRDVVRKADGSRDIEKADAIYDELQGKYNHNEAILNKEAAQIKQPYADMKITKAEDAYIQMLGELRHNPDTKLTVDEVNAYYEMYKENIDTEKVDRAIEMARETYDELLVRVNEVLREQGMKEIPYRQGYFPHFREDKQSFLAKLFNWKTRNNDIPTDIAGLTENFNPNRSWQSFNKERKGDTTDYSFTKGMDTYVQGALDWVHHIEDIQKRRAFENYLRYIHSEKGVQERIDAIHKSEEYDAVEMQEQIDLILAEASNPLNNFVVDLRAGTNTLANKKSSMDRSMEEATNRHFYSVMTNISNRVSANMVGGSISSALTNFIPITQSWGEVSPVSSLRAMGETIRSTFRDDGTIAKSDFLTNRLRKADNLYKSGWDKVSDGIGIMFDAIDSFTSQTVWRSKYLENISHGMSESEAIKNADQFAENVLAGRSRGNQPTIFDSKNPLVKTLTAFQLEVNNQYGYMRKDMPQDIESKAKLVKGYATMFLGAYAYNALFSKLTGRDAAFDPIGIIEDLLRDMGLFGDDEEEEVAPTDVVMNLTENILQEVPFVGGLMGGGRVPISSAMPYDGNVMDIMEGASKLFLEGDTSDLTSEWLKPVYYVVSPVAGGQVKKTIQGLSMFSDDHPIAGSYTKSGDLRFPVDDTIGSRVKAALFGQYASENAREYFDNGYAPLDEKKIQEYSSLGLSYEDYWAYRDDMSAISKRAEEDGASDEDVVKSKYIGSVNSELSAIQKEKDEVMEDAKLSTKEKEAKIRELDKQFDELANERYNSYNDVSFDGDYANIGNHYYRWYTPKNGEAEWRKMDEDEVAKYQAIRNVGANAHYATNGTTHYRLDEGGDPKNFSDWTKISDKDLARQREVTRELGITPEEYWSETETSFIPMKKGEYEYAYENPGNYAVAKAVGGYDAYMGYSNDLYDIKADKDANGKSISGSRKAKVLDYINNLDADYYTRIILWKSEYPSDDSYNNEIIEYLNGRDDISFEETIAILRKLGFDVTDDGDISW